MTKKANIQKDLAKRLGSSLSAARKQAALTQGELAEKVGVDTETISRFERGATMPSLVTLQMLAVALNVTMAELIGEASSMPNDQAQLIASWLSPLSVADRHLLLDMNKIWASRLQRR